MMQKIYTAQGPLPRNKYLGESIDVRENLAPFSPTPNRNPILNNTLRIKSIRMCPIRLPIYHTLKAGLSEMLKVIFR